MTRKMNFVDSRQTNCGVTKFFLLMTVQISVVRILEVCIHCLFLESCERRKEANQVSLLVVNFLSFICRRFVDSFLMFMVDFAMFQSQCTNYLTL